MSTPVPSSSEEQTTRTHELKVWQQYGDALDAGTKTFEYRRDDRGFDVGDTLWLREVRPLDISEIPAWALNDGCVDGFAYTGREWMRRVTYIARGGVIPPGFCVMSIEPLPSSSPVSAGGDEKEVQAAIEWAQQFAGMLENIQPPCFDSDGTASKLRTVLSALSTATSRAERAEEDSKRLDAMERAGWVVGPDTGLRWTVSVSAPTGGGDCDEVELTREHRPATLRDALDAARSASA